MSTLKDLLDQRMSLDDQIEAAYGELTPEMEEEITKIEITLPEKIDRYCGLIDRLSQDLILFEDKAQKYFSRATAIKNLKTKLNDNIKHQMIARNIIKLEGFNEVFTITKGKPTVVIEQAAILPRAYIETTITEKPKKNDLREAMERGEIFSNVSLQPTFVLRRDLKK